MTQPNDPRDREILHFTITPAAFSELTRMLGDMQYKHAAAPLQVLTEGSRVVFKREPTDIPDGDKGSINDNPEPHEWMHYHAFDGKGTGYGCKKCGSFVPGERDEAVPESDGCLGIVDNDDERSE